jgi:predicted N-acyltransferase
VSLVLLKDFPASYRRSLSAFSTNGYTRIASMPMTRLRLEGFADFEEYMRVRLSRTTRKNMRRKFKRLASRGGVSMEVVNDITPEVDEV